MHIQFILFYNLMLFHGKIRKCQEAAVLLKKNIEQILVGSEQSCDLMMMSLLAGGHILLEDVPGTGKTTLAKAVAQSLNLSFKRVQFTPDLMPSDLIGIQFYNQAKGEFEFRPGPLFTQLVLADEINRAAPRTQSSLLEAMEEHQISVEGTTYSLPEPFFVIATQNPIENQGTFPLPEAQIDRFMVRIHPGYPSPQEEVRMLKNLSAQASMPKLDAVLDGAQLLAMRREVDAVRIHDVLLNYALQVISKTRDHERIQLGVSPRGALAWIRCAKAKAAMKGRDYVLPDDLKACAQPVLAHRLILGGLSLGSDRQAEAVLAQILEEIPVPVEKFQG